ncbi:adhesion G protein-coupled receptor L4-like [Scylla paramamosain]|uniref:adhesion G protein-coupled receptor L4-like n=1 Tax=Scylla paramamosain TaxID=85552 RepID=UPI003083EDC6
MALVATISVQVARDGPARRASVAEGPTRVLHGQHATLATNLATSLASAHVLLIFGIQATGRAWVCGVVGLLLHFLHLVSCFWLLALTTRLLGSLLQRPAMHTAFYCASAWGASLGLVVVSYVVNPEGYETRRYCWMSVERGMLVSFIVPVCSLILVNAGLCLAAQKLLLDMREGVKHEVMAVHKRDLRGAVCLLPLEGVSWFLAVVALEDHQSLALDCAAALVSACLGWLILYFHGWSWRCHGLCWLRHRLHSSSTSSTSSNSSRRMEDLSLPLTARYDHDLAHQPLLHPLPPPPPPPLPAQGTVTVTPAPCPPTAVTPPPPARPEEFPLQPIFPGHERREVY